MARSVASPPCCCRGRRCVSLLRACAALAGALRSSYHLTELYESTEMRQCR